MRSLQDLVDYQRDFLERSILFWDTLRQRVNNMLSMSAPGCRRFSTSNTRRCSTRRFQHPANYALLRITEIGEDCWDDCVNPEKPPVIIIDPRAGHGPGIGGFKRDLEVGMAMREGHSVYFVIFYPEPAPGQTSGRRAACPQAFCRGGCAAAPRQTAGALWKLPGRLGGHATFGRLRRSGRTGRPQRLASVLLGPASWVPTPCVSPAAS